MIVPPAKQPSKLSLLLTSRKFWFAVVGAVTEGYLYASGHATADVVAASLAALGSAYMVATGIEDAGSR